MLLQYALTLYVSSPTIKSFAVKFTTTSLLKTGNMFQYEVIPPDLSQFLVPSWEEILMYFNIHNDMLQSPSSVYDNNEL